MEGRVRISNSTRTWPLRVTAGALFVLICLTLANSVTESKFPSRKAAMPAPQPAPSVTRASTNLSCAPTWVARCRKSHIRFSKPYPHQPASSTPSSTAILRHFCATAIFTRASTQSEGIRRKPSARLAKWNGSLAQVRMEVAPLYGAAITFLKRRFRFTPRSTTGHCLPAMNLATMDSTGRFFPAASCATAASLNLFSRETAVSANLRSLNSPSVARTATVQVRHTLPLCRLALLRAQS